MYCTCRKHVAPKLSDVAYRLNSQLKLPKSYTCIIAAETARISSPGPAIAPWSMRSSTTCVCPHAAAHEIKECPAGDTRERRRATPSLSSPQERFCSKYSADVVALPISTDSSWTLSHAGCVGARGAVHRASNANRTEEPIVKRFMKLKSYNPSLL